MTTDFVLERLNVIVGSASEKESGNETASRMISFLKSHKAGNEASILRALDIWRESENSFENWLAEYLIKELELKTHTEQSAAGDV
jgi:hypothetical protein